MLFLKDNDMGHGNFCELRQGDMTISKILQGDNAVS